MWRFGMILHTLSLYAVRNAIFTGYPRFACGFVSAREQIEFCKDVATGRDGSRRGTTMCRLLPIGANSRYMSL